MLMTELTCAVLSGSPENDELVAPVAVEGAEGVLPEEVEVVAAEAVVVVAAGNNSVSLTLIFGHLKFYAFQGWTWRTWSR